MERKVALITGITGQDGSFLAGFIRKKVMMAVHTVHHQRCVVCHWRTAIAHLEGKPTFLALCRFGDSMISISDSVTEIYNLAAQSHVQVGSTLRNLANVDAGALSILQRLSVCVG